MATPAEEGMATPTEVFSGKAPGIMDRLIADFGLTDIQAAAVVGNLGHECNGFTQLQEVNPLGGGRGGAGWAQWTGPRRRSFEAYCAHVKKSPTSDAANYGYLWRELSGHQPGFDYRPAIIALKRQAGLTGAVKAFENAYERAGVKAYVRRNVWARRALAVHGDNTKVEVKRIQELLVGAGFDPGPVDGILGARTRAAILAALTKEADNAK